MMMNNSANRVWKYSQNEIQTPGNKTLNSTGYQFGNKQDLARSGSQQRFLGSGGPSKTQNNFFSHSGSGANSK